MNSLNNNVLEQDDTTKSTENPCVTESCSGIYGLRNKTTGKWYVGQSVNIQNRWRSYRRMDCIKQPKILNALRRYGVKDFDFVLIETCEKCPWILDYREMYWIRQLRSVDNGYNVLNGGLFSNRPEKTKEKMSRAQKGLWTPAKQSASDRRRGVPLPKWWVDKLKVAKRPPQSKELIEKRAEANRGKSRTQETCKNISLSLQDDSIHSFYNHNTSELFVGTRTDLMKKYPEVQPQGICAVIKARRPSHLGWTVQNLEYGV